MDKRLRSALAIPAALVPWITPAVAQGEYVNFEAPQVSPIAIATIGEATFVLACNTPDGSVEIYDAQNFAGPEQGFLLRVPVGLSPVTVRWNAASQRFYTCNYLGDSVSVVHLALGDALSATLERTVNVGDEPTDIVFPANMPGEAAVSLHGRSGIVIVDAVTLVKNGSEHRLVEEGTTGARHAVKAPRRLGALPDGRLLALNTKGGNQASKYDLDLYVLEGNDPASDPVRLVGGMGSTNMSFAYDPGGNDLYVVGGFAQNNTALGGAAILGEGLGFVRSFLWVVDMKVPGSDPDVAMPPAPGSISFNPPETIDLNRDYLQAGVVAVAEDDRVSQPSDVLLIPGEEQVEHVLVAGFGTDNVMIYSPDSLQNGGWMRARVDLLPLSNYGAVGPRGLAYDTGADRVWVLNRLDNSLACFTPDAVTPGVVTRIPLRFDPTPAEVRYGRQFLYSAQKTSGNGMVACASCHVDGTTDSLAWNMGVVTGGVFGPMIPLKIVDKEPGPGFPTQFHEDKGFLVTQTLQGLVNSHIPSPSDSEESDIQYLTTNAPYHWRGDKEGFVDFNEAFVNIQGMDDEATAGVNGILPGDMIAFREFVETILYPPNWEQPDNRRYVDLSGEVLGLNNVNANDENVGRGALQGLKLYHITDSMNGRSCVHCHTLPEGSSNTLFLTSTNLKVPLENAQVRGLFQRESAWVDDFLPTAGMSWIRVADRGLRHNGLLTSQGPVQRSINDFNTSFTNLSSEQQEDLTELGRQWDWGVGPMIGRALTVDSGLTTDPDTLSQLAEMVEDAGEANSGLAVYLRRNDGTKVQGWWCDMGTPSATAADPVFRRVGGNQTLTQDALLALVGTENDLIVFHSVPCGSERRVVHKTGNPPALQSRKPKDLELLPMVPNTAFEDVTAFTVNLDPSSTVGGGHVAERFLSTQQTQELELAIRAVNPLDPPFGVSPEDRHEPPRRLRVTGKDIVHGAKLRLGLEQGAVGSGEVVWVEFDLAATQYRYDGVTPGQVVWETLEELDFGMQMALLNGSPERADVADVLCAVTEAQLQLEKGDLDPIGLNSYQVEVVNQDGKTGATLTLQSLSIQDGRDAP